MKMVFEINYYVKNCFEHKDVILISYYFFHTISYERKIMGNIALMSVHYNEYIYELNLDTKVLHSLRHSNYLKFNIVSKMSSFSSSTNVKVEI